MCKCFAVANNYVVVHSLVMSNSLLPRGLQHARLPCLSLSPGACSHSCPWSRWCHPTISSSVAPYSSCLQCFPTLGSFPMSWLFTSDGQSGGASASSSVLPMYNQDWFPLGWISLISLLSKELLRSSLAMILRNQCLMQNHTVKATGFMGEMGLWTKHWNILPVTY